MLNRKQPKYSRSQDYRITTVHYVAFKIILKHILSDMEIVISIFRTIQRGWLMYMMMSRIIYLA